ncbi:MAG: ferritin-like domain-containing protein [Bacillaceae bacterium]|nr:ferritin-like domain-containing protein [Bacillaceae bacterium]
MIQSEVVHELNQFLKGQYMGIHAYEDYIYQAKDQSLRDLFQRIQMDHKMHAIKVAERIQNLGGKAADDQGLIGDVQYWFSKISGHPEGDEELIKGALKGEGMGIETSEKIVRGDVDEESRQLIGEILDRDRRHLETLKNHLDHYKN